MIAALLRSWGFFFARTDGFTTTVRGWLEDSDPAGVDYPAIDYDDTPPTEGV